MRFAVIIVEEFIYVMRRSQKEIEPITCQHLVQSLLKAKCYYQLTQMIRSGILTDSKQLACLLLSVKSQWQPAIYLGKDMLLRLDCTNDLLETIH